MQGLGVLLDPAKKLSGDAGITLRLAMTAARHQTFAQFVDELSCWSSRFSCTALSTVFRNQKGRFPGPPSSAALEHVPFRWNRDIL
jgi:hypothetical protein